MKRLGLLISICVIALFAACAQQEVSKNGIFILPKTVRQQQLVLPVLVILIRMEWIPTPVWQTLLRK